VDAQEGEVVRRCGADTEEEVLKEPKLEEATLLFTELRERWSSLRFNYLHGHPNTGAKLHANYGSCELFL
jgi:hypothetical protein